MRNLSDHYYPSSVSAWLLVVCFLTTLVVMSPVTYAGVSREDILKAAFIIHFVRFTTWPEDNDKQFSSTSEFIIGLMGENIFEAYLAEFAKKASKKLNKKIIVRKYESIDDIKQVPQIIFFSNNFQTPEKLLKVYKNKSILTISDKKDFINNCGIIRLFLQKNRVLFEINYNQAKLQKLNFSSKMMKVAKIIKNAETRCN